MPSGRVEFDQAAILRADPAVAAERVSALLADGVQLDGVLSPRDAMSRAVLEVLPALAPTEDEDAAEAERRRRSDAEEPQSRRRS